MTVQAYTAGLIDRLKGLQGVKCRMVHERIALDPETGQPKENPANPGDFKRVDLCPVSVRQRRLACGHTDARRWFREGIRALADRQGRGDAQVQAFQEEFSRLDAELGMLDHAKGDAEYALASATAARGTDGPEQPVIDARAEIERIADRHGYYVEALEDLRDRLVKALEGENTQ